MTFRFNEIQEDFYKLETEIFTYIPRLSNEDYLKLRSSIPEWNDGLYSKLRFSKPLPEGDEIEIQYKYVPTNHKTISFFNNDYYGPLDENNIIYRTSALRSQLKPNERIFPVLVPDHCFISPKLNNLSVGFCGFMHNIRPVVFNKFNYSKTDFIFYDRFFTHHPNPMNARRGYYHNLISNSFTLCVRGYGNFSYRLYEALSFGRIPIFIDTDSQLPFEKIINWDEYLIRVKFEDMDKVDFNELICEGAERIIPEKNRQFWEEWLSPHGYYNKFLLDF